MSSAVCPRPPLHIIEPTLNSDVGHCMSLVRALSNAAMQAGCTDITVWGGRDAQVASWQGPVKLMPHFKRGWRRLQALALYRKLLRQPGRMLVSTAGSADLVSLDWAARSCGLGRIPDHKAALFVHWLNIKPGKARLYQGIARRQPGLKILAPTASVARFFQECGFKAQVVPYPLDTAGDDTAAAPSITPFRHLLVPGAARMDKGFGHIVAMIEAMQQRHLTWPIVVQTSLEHGHDKDEALGHALRQLKACTYSGLTICDQPMDRETYRAQFQGAIVIQPYGANSFRDRVSGVTLDALHAGSPVVVTEGTWMARLVARHGAGIATGELTPAGLLQAIDTVLADHTGFAGRALVAAAAVESEHSARGLIDAVLTGDAP